MDKVVLAYSGGLDTSVIAKYLMEERGVEVITVTVDVGQKEDLDEVRKRAEMIGVLKHYSIDAKQEFIDEYVHRAIKANAFYERAYPVSTALSRPLIASKVVEVALKEGASAVAHGCTGKGNDQVRFEVTFRALAPDVKILAPVREWNMTRKQEAEYAEKHGIPVSTGKKLYSVDQNLWGRSIECGPLEQPDREPPEEVYAWTSPPENCPDSPEYLTVSFERGIPSALNGETTDPVTMITTLNEIAGGHGIGRIDHIEDRLIGIKSREVYECPAAICLLSAHIDLEKAVLTRHEVEFKEIVDSRWATLVYTGLWADPLREALDAFIEETQQTVSGEVRLKLYKGSVRVAGRSSPHSLYDVKLATYDVDSTFDQSLAAGFIQLWGLQTQAAKSISREKLKKKK